MLAKEQWWEVIGVYNESLFPLQWIGLIIIIGITGCLIYWDKNRANILIKTILSAMNLFIGIRFFILNEGFPLPLRISQGVLFISIGLLYAYDVKRKKIQYTMPKTGWKKLFFIIGMIFIIIYPFIGGMIGKESIYWIAPGTLPCPTTAYGLLLLICAEKRNSKALFVLMLIWAIPFPPMIQIPKYGVYEDGIMFMIGLVGIAVLMKDIMENSRDRSSTSIERR